MSQLSQGTIPAITALTGILGYVVHPRIPIQDIQFN